MIAFRMKEDFNLGQEEPTEVQYISSGCVMHTREFIEKMIEEYPELRELRPGHFVACLLY